MNFFVLHYVVGSKAETVFESVDDRRLGEAPRCPKCGVYVGMKLWLPPYKVRLSCFGDAIGDVAFECGPNILVSEDFLIAWRECKLVGMEEPERVDVVSVEPKPAREKLPRFFHVDVPRGMVTIDYSTSVIIRKGRVTCSLCGGAGIVDAIREVHVDEASWQGQDLFVPWGVNGIIVVSERVVEAAQKHHLHNVTTEPLDSYEWDSLA